MLFPGPGSSSSEAKGRSGFYWSFILFHFSFCFKQLQTGGVTLPGGAATADCPLPVLPVPNAIRQKVIPGKTQQGHLQHKATSEEMMGPLSPMGKPHWCCPVAPACLGWKISLLLSLQGRFFGMLSLCPWGVEGIQEPPWLPAAVGPSSRE